MQCDLLHKVTDNAYLFARAYFLKRWLASSYVLHMLNTLVMKPGETTACVASWFVHRQCITSPRNLQFMNILHPLLKRLQLHGTCGNNVINPVGHGAVKVFCHTFIHGAAYAK